MGGIILMSDFIIYLAPFAGGLISWFIVNHISEVKDQITEVKGKIGGVSMEIEELKISMAKMSTDLDYLKKDGKINEDKVIDIFENNIVKVIRRAKTRFE